MHELRKSNRYVIVAPNLVVYSLTTNLAPTTSRKRQMPPDQLWNGYALKRV